MKIQIDNNFIKRTLFAIIILQSMVLFQISQNRLFDFDEFQVLYASASLIKGKTLYHDQIDSHFPLANIIIALTLKTVGFKTNGLLAARLVIMFILLFSLYFIYRIATLLKDNKTGLLAVVLTMSCMVFVNKGIEIRHDVFNMFFNVIGVYWALKYLKTDNKLFVIISGACLGLALAATQKAIVWNFGILTGLSICIINKNGFIKLIKVLPIYILSLVLAFSIVMLILVVAYNEHLYSIVQIGIIDLWHYLIPNNILELLPNRVIEPLPVPPRFSKINVLETLLIQNGLFYSIAIIAIIIRLKKIKRENEIILITMWALSGILFYLYMKRPFFHSFLPTIPPIGILVASLLSDLNKKLMSITNNKRIIAPLFMLTFLLLVGWPTYITAKITTKRFSMGRQMKNVAFCINNLNTYDKVLCFTQQQVFFDPIFHGIRSNECGVNIMSMETDCVKNKIIKNKCKVVIFDHRTYLLKREIRSIIEKNFVYSGIGDICIPGFQLQPNSEINRQTWTPGFYYSPTSELIINGSKISSNLIYLDQQLNSFKNLTSRIVRLVYIFHPESFKFQNNKNKKVNGAPSNVQK